MNILYVQPLEGVPADLVNGLLSHIRSRYRFNIRMGQWAVPLQSCHDKQRGQYYSTRVLLTLRESFRATGSAKLLAILPHDLFIPVLTFVFGEAELSGNLAVVSYHRLANERYGMPPDPTLLVERLLKESLHEIGHLYGLVHCFEPGCVMRASTSVEEIDVKSADFCRLCSRVLPPKHI